MTDDYYEDKALAEITERGLKPGDPVGDLIDPSTQNEVASLGGALGPAGGGSKADRGSGGGGIYRAGGPTTLFGSSGMGPFSDGPLNAVRKSLLSRDNVTEENWMWMMAARVREADEEWAKWRREARKVPEPIEGVCMGDVLLPNGAPARVGASGVSASKRAARVVVEEGLVVDDGDQDQGLAKRKKFVGFESEIESSSSAVPLGVYEPHSHLIHCRLLTSLISSCTDTFNSQTARTPSQRLLAGFHCPTTRRIVSKARSWEGRRWAMELGALLGSIRPWSYLSLASRKEVWFGYLQGWQRRQLKAQP